MALRGGNALNKGTARKSAKFLKAPAKKKPTIVTRYKPKAKPQSTKKMSDSSAKTMKKPTMSRREKAQKMMQSKTSLRTRKRK